MTTTTLPDIPGFVRIDAASGHTLHRRSDTNPDTDTHSAIIAAVELNDWAETPTADIEAERAAAKAEREYRADVVARIRERYSADDETAILRKAIALLTTPATMAADGDNDHADAEQVMLEFAEYNAFAEQCKAEAKERIDID